MKACRIRAVFREWNISGGQASTCLSLPSLVACTLGFYAPPGREPRKPHCVIPVWSPVETRRMWASLSIFISISFSETNIYLCFLFRERVSYAMQRIFTGNILLIYSSTRQPGNYISLKVFCNLPGHQLVPNCDVWLCFTFVTRTPSPKFKCKISF